MRSVEPSQADIPIIDISSSNPRAPQELLSAASEHGFLFIDNNSGTGISPRSIAEVFEISKNFFAAPVQVKQTASIASNKAGKNHGWLGRGVEKLDPKVQQRPDVKEAFNMADPGADGEVDQFLPEPLERYKDTLVEFQRACDRLCNRIFEKLAEAFEIDRDWFIARHDVSRGPRSSVFRMLFYAARGQDYVDGVDIRAGAHSDYGSITLLFQLPGQPGLEIKTPTGGWAAVPVNPLSNSDGPLPILVNFGDLLEDWTGGLLKSTVHRVVFPSGEGAGDRYSLAYFCQPLDDALLEPVPSTIVQDYFKKSGRQPRLITAKDHLMERLAATYTVK